MRILWLFCLLNKTKAHDHIIRMDIYIFVQKDVKQSNEIFNELINKEYFIKQFYLVYLITIWSYKLFLSYMKIIKLAYTLQYKWHCDLFLISKLIAN